MFLVGIFFCHKLPHELMRFFISEILHVNHHIEIIAHVFLAVVVLSVNVSETFSVDQRRRDYPCRA